MSPMTKAKLQGGLFGAVVAVALIVLMIEIAYAVSLTFSIACR